ncbi:ATP-binding protein [Micromonospora rosaria]|uniref:histidine kinase n=1 Tax=Micromonospora rosaria TaxID=47874 RepID=A0A136PSY4_9ACTN|nr:nitrate- and nitrite sensing domain-containing protein [Micromonospora rosaria]KXK61599.1 ATP-binding protein [Micromonospora rosaria]
MGTRPDANPGGVSSHRRRRFDVRVVPHRRRSAFRLRDWRMGTKLTAVLIIPSLAFLVLAGVQSASLVGRTTTLSDFAGQVAVGVEINAAVHALQQERDRTAGELAELRASGRRLSGDAAASSLRPLQEATDRAMADLRRAAAPLADSDPSWQIAYAEVLEAAEQVVFIRGAVPAAVLSSDTILSNYHRAINSLLDLLAEPSPGEGQPVLTDAVLRYVQLARVKELSSRVSAQLHEAARAGEYGLEDQVTLTDLRAQQLTALGAFRVAATSGQIARYDRASVDPAFVAATTLEEKSLPGDGSEPTVLPAGEWWSASEQRQALLGQVLSGVLDDAVAQAEDASGSQLRETLLVAGAIATVLGAAVLTSVLIGRSIARSMRQLRGQALRIAQVELPDTLDRLRTVSGGVPEIEVAPAVVRSLDEIGELAEAFVAVHRSAVSVAVEQATMRRNVNAMFVNLARRSQVLVERQLKLLDDLEREESDPDQLENLFKLDHLAARMRRNDESLLVLAGTDSTRRWNRPVGLGNVLLAASAEIEQYQRVRHDSVVELQLVGHAVGDLVHLVAELLENATSFSRPETTVVVSAWAEEDGVSVQITDQGLGMSAAALAEANALLASPPAADVAASERMGLFVVSHLAVRHGVQVRLHPGESAGLVARIRLPGGLLAPAGSIELDLPGVVVGAPPVSLVDAPTVATNTPGVPAAGPPVGSPVSGPVGAIDEAIAPEVAELPVAGRRPRPTTVPRPARTVPVRAEDVLAPAAGRPEKSGWWSPQGPTPSMTPSGAPPERPVTGGINAQGLPVRVPMAQLASVTRSARPEQPAPRYEPDPEAVGGMLSRFYSGVRRAENEETTEMMMPPAGVRSEGGHQ